MSEGNDEFADATPIQFEPVEVSHDPLPASLRILTVRDLEPGQAGYLDCHSDLVCDTAWRMWIRREAKTRTWPGASELRLSRTEDGYLILHIPRMAALPLWTRWDGPEAGYDGYEKIARVIIV